MKKRIVLLIFLVGFIINVINLQVYANSKLYVVLEIDEVLQLRLTESLDESSTLSWTSNDENIAAVDNDGRVSAIDIGKTQINLQINDSSEDYVNIFVVEKDEAEMLRIAVQLKVDETIRLILDDSREAEWNTLDSSIAVVSNKGEVTAVSEGLALITGTIDTEIYTIYILVEGFLNNLDLANVTHYDTIREIIIDNAYKDTELNINLFDNLNGTSKWHGGVLAPNGKIYGIPFNSTQILEIDPQTRKTSTFGDLVGSNKWQGGVVAPNGRIYGIPTNATEILELDPETRTITTFGSLTGTSKWQGGVLAPNGKIYGIPFNSTQVLEISPRTREVITFGNLTNTGKWIGGVLAPNGKIYGIPFNSREVLEIDPETNTTTTFGNLTGSNKWRGGVLAPNGKIYGIPYNSTEILEIDPETREVTTFGNLTGTVKWAGGVLASNGKIYAMPLNAREILEIDPETNTTKIVKNVDNGMLKWVGGVLAPNNKIYAIPSNSTTVLEIDLGSELTSLDFNEIISAWINKF